MKKHLLIPISCFLLPLLTQFMVHRDFGMSEVEFRALDQNELLTLLISLLVIKPLYLLLCLGSIIYLYQQTSHPLRLVFWGLVVFLQAELICGAYHLAFRRELMISEYIHAWGIIFELGLFALAALEFVGERVQGRSRVLLITSGVILCLLPLLAPIQAGGYRTELFDIPYGFSRFEFNVWTETRAMPWMSLVLFILAVITSRVDHNPFASQPVKIYLSTGTGLTCFSLWRVILGALYAQELVLFEFWEEMIQLTLLSCIAFTLWKFHRSARSETKIRSL